MIRTRARARNGGGVSVPWYEQGDIESVAPSLWLDFKNNRYAVNGASVALTDLSTFTRASVASYIDSAGAMQQVSSGVMRYNWNPVTFAREGVLIEEARTNLFLNSTTGATQGVTVTAQVYTVSFYGTGTITFSGAYVGSLVGSGAYPTRSTITFTPSAGTVTCTVTGTVQYVNFEAGSFATSWVPTAGSTVARAADILRLSNSNTVTFSTWWPTTNASICTTYVPKTLINNKNILSVSDGTNANRLLIRPALTGNNGGTAFTNSGNVTQFNETNIGLETLNQYNASSFRYKLNDCHYCCNGILGTVDTSVTLMVSPNEMKVGAGPASNELFNGCVSEIRVYNAALTSVSLQKLGSVNKANAYFFGDSVTFGLNASAPTTKTRWSSLAANLGGYGELNSGISGTVLQNTPLNTTGLPKTDNGRDRYAATMTGLNRADYVYILYGINDIKNSVVETNLTAALFENDLREIVAGLIADGYTPSKIVLGTTPYFDGTIQVMHDAMNLAIYNCAVDYGTKYADVYTAMVNGGGSSLLDDGTHPTDTGHALIAATMAAATTV